MKGTGIHIMTSYIEIYHIYHNVAQINIYISDTRPYIYTEDTRQKCWSIRRFSTINSFCVIKTSTYISLVDSVWKPLYLSLTCSVKSHNLTSNFFLLAKYTQTMECPKYFYVHGECFREIMFVLYILSSDYPNNFNKSILNLCWLMQSSNFIQT